MFVCVSLRGTSDLNEFIFLHPVDQMKKIKIKKPNKNVLNVV